MELEGNDNIINRFIIYYFLYNYKAKNFIKSLNCFNRIEISFFTNKKVVCAILFVSESQIWRIWNGIKLILKDKLFIINKLFLK